VHRQSALERIPQRHVEMSSSIFPASTFEEVENVVDQREQVPARVEHVVDIAELPLVQLAVRLQRRSRRSR